MRRSAFGSGMAINILTRMPRRADHPDAGVELVELRVLDGPNRFFTRPAMKLEFAAKEPGQADEVAERAVRAIQRLHDALGLPEPRVTTRSSVDGLRVAVAFAWRRRTISQAIAAAAGRLALGRSNGRRELAGLRATAHGPLAHLPRPRIPIVAVTGTNGKSTTTRLIAHIATGAGLKVGMTNSDGIFVRGELIEAGDWTGFGGAERVLAEPGLDLAVLETARGGILRRGVGVAYNDVSVVTNISADHLGLGGIDTLDQLAEVKAVITKITKSDGWCVLNADDPRTFAMRLGTKAQIWVFTRDPDSPAGRSVLSEGGRMTTLLGGWVCVLAPRADPLQVVEVIDVPMTLAGLSRVNVENVLAVTSATLALAFSVEQVAAGLRSFDPNQSNPGRMNIWTLPVAGGTISVVIDLAHNEAGLEALLEIMSGIRPPNGRLLLGLGTAGDRGDEVFVRLGETAAVGADLVEIVHKRNYLRGRSMAEINDLITAGAAHAGMKIQRWHDSELDGLVSLADQAQHGDVVAIMTHQDREELDRWLVDHQATRDDADALRAKVAV